MTGADARERYALKEQIGSGGMGVVYRAFDREREIDVALKTFKASSPAEAYSLRREFRSVARVRHPNLVELYDLVVEQDGNCFYTMELVRGETVTDYCWRKVDEHDIRASGTKPVTATDDVTASWDDLCAEGAQFDEARVRQVIAQLWHALGAMHGAGVVHRDLKPGNVLVNREGIVKVIDFGLVIDHASLSADAHEGKAIGSLGYMSPEQAEADAPVTVATDWYAVGGLLFEVLTGRLPFEGAPLDVLNQKRKLDPPSPRDFNRFVPEDLDDLCTRLLARDPKDRATRDEVRLFVDDRQHVPLTPSTVPAALGEQEPFAGRDEEMAALLGDFADVRAGACVVRAIDGPSGIGKSALVRAFIAKMQATTPGLVVVDGRCSEHEFVQFRALDAVIDSLSAVWRKLPSKDAFAILPRVPGLLPTLFPVLGTVPAVEESSRGYEPPKDPVARREAALIALSETFVRLADRRPLVMFIDDYQRADMESRALLSRLLSAPSVPAMLLVIAHRDAPDLELPSVHGVPGRQMRLRPLRAEQIAQLCAQSGAQLHRGDVAHITTESGGHPLFALELARFLGRRGGDVRSPTLQEAIYDRARSLGETELKVTTLLALSPRPLPRDVLSAAAELPRATVFTALENVEHARLVREREAGGVDVFEPYHDQVRGALRDPLPPGDRSRLQHRLAEAWTARGDNPLATAEAWHATGAFDLAATAYREAAAEAQASMRFGVEAELLALVCRLYAEDPGAAPDYTLRRDYARALKNAGRTTEAAAEYRRASTMAPADEVFECEREEAFCYLISGDVPRGVELYRTLLRRVGAPIPRSFLRAVVEFLWSHVRFRFRSFRFDERRLLPSGEATSDKFRLLWEGGFGLHFVDFVRGGVLFARALQQAEREGDRRGVALALYLHASFLAAFGGKSFSRAREVVHRADALGHSDDAYVNAIREGTVGVFRYYECSFDEAYERLSLATAEFQKVPGTVREQVLMQISELWSLYYLGDMRELALQRERLFQLSKARGDRIGRQFVDVGLPSFPWVVSDQPELAIAAGRASLSESRTTPVYQWPQYWATFGLCQALLYQGDPREASRVLAAELRHMRRAQMLKVEMIQIELCHLRARIALARFAQDGDEKHLTLARKMVRTLSRHDVLLARLSAGLTRAGIASALGQRAEAADLFEVAGRLAEQGKVRLFCSAARYAAAALRQDEAQLASMVRAAKADGIVKPPQVFRVLAPWIERP